MRKRFLAIIGLLIFILLFTTYAYASFKYTTQGDEFDVKYFIHSFDDSIPGAEYILKIDVDGKVELKVNEFSSAVDGETLTDRYKLNLEDEEFKKIKDVIKYYDSKYKIKKKDNYIFYFDSDEEKIAFDRDDEISLVNFLSAVESILKNNEIIDEIQYREYGNRWLDDIILEINQPQEPEYKDINLIDYAISGEKKVSFENDKETEIKIMDKKLYIENTLTNLESSFEEIYIVDLDGDGIKEIISRVVDESLVEKNTYIIYRYKSGVINEALRISIDGDLDSFKIKNNILRIEYIPTGGALNEIKQEDFKLEK